MMKVRYIIVAVGLLMNAASNNVLHSQPVEDYRLSPDALGRPVLDGELALEQGVATYLFNVSQVSSGRAQAMERIIIHQQ